MKLQVSIENLALRMHSKGCNNSNNSNNSSNNANHNNSGPRPNSGCCHFCGRTGCRISNCSEVEEFAKCGKCQRNAQGLVVLPNGQFVPAAYTGKTLKERMLKWHEANPPTPTVTALLDSPCPPTVTALLDSPCPPTVTALLDSPCPPTVTAALLDSPRPPPLGVEQHADIGDPSDEEILDMAKVLATQYASFAKNKGKIAPAPRTYAGAPPPGINTPPTDPTPAPAPPVETSVPATKSTNKTNDAAYRFRAPCENPVLAQRVIDRALDASITISNRELLAVSGDARKSVKDLVTGRRVAPDGSPALVQDVLINDIHPSDTASPQVAVDVAPLRTIEGTLGDKLVSEMVLDGGSGVVSVSQSMWEMLGTPLLDKKSMNMESAHGTIEATLGVLQDFPIRIGPSVFYLQVQVSSSLPCPVLLGRPFFMLATAKTVDYEDGSQNITLNDPNSGESFTIPTQPRTNAPPTKVRGRQVHLMGF
jgi:hypothetical protein